MSVTSDQTVLETGILPDERGTFQPRLVGVVAEFEHPDTLVAAAEKLRDAGYTRWDTYTPFPIHGMDQAMGIRYTVLPWLVFAGGLTGTIIAILMQWYMNGSRWAEFAIGWPFAGYEYPISGKPYFSLPANIPIAFELTVLLAAFTAFFGMLALNRLLQWYNPMFKIERFRRVTDDRFFVSIDANDPKFDASGVVTQLRGLGATAVDECWDNEDPKLPGRFFTFALVLFALSLVPPIAVMWNRSVPFTTPEYHPVQDMDFQAKFKSQQRNVFFADHRAERPTIEGTVARGQLVGDERFSLGINPGQAMASMQDEAAAAPAANAAGEANADTADEPEQAEGNGEQAAGAAGAAPAGGDTPANPPHGMVENQDWVETIPIPVSEELMARGQLQYGIYCAPCHGYGGYGDGVINQRAMSIRPPQAEWIPVPSLHTSQTRNRPDGYIFRAITEGVRKMPAYGHQIAPKDRWAIVLYLRALQRSQGAQAQ